MTILRPKGGRVYLSKNALANLSSYRQISSSAPEAGGVVLGRLILNSTDIVIDEITVPTAQDKVSRYSFFRSRKRTQKRIDDAWHDSLGTLIYLGEWHTHPEDEPHPSFRDRRDWKRLSHSCTYEQESLLFIIVGRKAIRIWELERNGEPKNLQSIEEHNQISCRKIPDGPR
jgi:integrative and conjugative element protein (TIGR02256 family)